MQRPVQRDAVHSPPHRGQERVVIKHLAAAEKGLQDDEPGFGYPQPVLLEEVVEVFHYDFFSASGMSSLSAMFRPRSST